MCRLLLNRFGALKAACTFSGSLKGVRGQHIPTLRWDWGCLNRNRVRAYRTHPTSGLEVSCGLRLATSGLEVSCGLRLALLINSKCFNIFFNIYSFPF